jgi:hypothetical protein
MKSPERKNSALAYDSVHEKFILFSGLVKFGEPPLGDLWILDTADGTWQEVPYRPTSNENGEEEPSQTGIPGFPLPSLVMGLALTIFFIAIGKPQRP